ncbi:unnamed protein product [Arctia plantaginis]|uniref:Uncharacterized protein n=1 Tax=Arctia plantaginis TaxID=874455 RepID=A0A8S1BGU6_ARCPL|nr:unnamed protein product [Arctia plantaginis]
MKGSGQHVGVQLARRCLWADRTHRDRVERGNNLSAPRIECGVLPRVWPLIAAGGRHQSCPPPPPPQPAAWCR